MKLYANITDSTRIQSVSISESHESATTVATFTTAPDGTEIGLGDSVDISLGYVGDYDHVFKGYVKKVDLDAPSGVTTITANDVMSRALDYFIVNTAPEPYIKQNIETGDLIKFVLQMAGLTEFDFDDTEFIYATGGSKAEINLVGSYDYAKTLADLIAWNLWAENDGVIYLKNRKPYPMYAVPPLQVGEEEDDGKYYGSFPVSLGAIPTSDILQGMILSRSEHDLRNRIVVYGGRGVYANAQSATSYDSVLDADIQVVPDDFYKAVCLSSLIITSSSFAQKACEYNLKKLNRVNYEITLTVVGRPYYHVRRVVTIDYPPLGITGDWYIFSCDHQFSSAGYTCNLVLRR